MVTKMADDEIKNDDFRHLNGGYGNKGDMYDFELESHRSYDSGFNLIADKMNGYPRSNPENYFDGHMSLAGSEHLSAPANLLHQGSIPPSSIAETLDREKPYTVERVDEDFHTHRWFKKPSRALSLIKMILAFVLAGLTLFCVVASKLSILSIAKRINKDNTNSTHRFFCKEGDPASCERETAVFMLTVSLMIPPAFSFIKQFIITCRKISHPWPTKLAILWGAVGTMLESAGLALFFVGLVHTVRDTDLILILMNALFIFPVISQFWKEFEALLSEKEMELSYHLYEKRRRRHKQNVALAIVAFVFQLGGICGILYLMWDREKAVEMIIIVPCSIVLLSVAWSPKIRKLQIDHDLAYIRNDISPDNVEQSKLPKNHRARYFRNTEEEVEIASDGTLPKKKSRTLKDDSSKIVVQTNTSRGKATLINCLIKLVFIPIFVLFFVYLFEVADILEMYQGVANVRHNDQLFWMFIIHIFASFVGFHSAWVGCMITLQRLCFAIPLTLSTPICVAIVLTKQCDLFYVGPCHTHMYNDNGTVVALLSVTLWLGQFFATTYYAWISQDFVMADEATLFWVPTYDGSLLEQNILLNRKNEATNEFFVNYRSLVKKSTIYICTTMYHEADYEVEQLLYSIAGVDRARRNEGRKFEAHIWFDDGVRDKTLKTYAIQLISLLASTVQVNAEDAIKLDTPYGMELKWILPGGMPFHVHMKDNFKVKNKKRWSQVMYMSYVLDFRERGNHDHSFILTTDADVKFHPEDVTALMDFMSRDPSVGAVCGRTHPMGTGPLVWYQTFDYAIGHWLLKVAEHVMGSVLCSPGCFSVYRCRALEDILPTYASSVECALDFLTKDMGEDRWLCTLMIERGWRLDYCASSTDITYCPESFDEFYKQRRRWGPSTLANQAVLIQTQSKMRRNNDDINLVFIVYQVLMLVSTVIGPGTVLLLLSSGLHAAYPSYVDLTTMFFVNLAVVLGYVYICLYYKQDTQLKVAQVLTFIYSIVMTITIVGLMIQVADDIEKQRVDGWDYFLTNATGEYTVDIKEYPNGTLTDGIHREFSFQFTPPSVFLFFLIGLFMLTAALHGFEGLQLVHGIWYLLCLPSGYILLMIYSLANITDRSWGTRENAVKKTKMNTENQPWNYIIYYKFKEIFFCCFKDMSVVQEVVIEKKEEPAKENKMKVTTKEDQPEEKKGLLGNTDEDEDNMSEMEGSVMDTQSEMGDSIVSGEIPHQPSVRYIKRHNNGTRKFQSQKRPANIQRQRSYYIGNPDYEHAYGNGYNQNGVYIGDADSDVSDYYITMNIEDWLDGPYSVYIKNFKSAGYDDTTFLMGLKEAELLDIGIKNRGHRKKIIAEIERLPPEEIDQDVPEDVYEWLMVLGLDEYWPLFEENSYAEPNALADLKLMDKPTLASTFNIIKPGHLKKLIKAISQLKYPTSGQRKIRQSKLALEKVQTFQLAEDNPEEFIFWDRLRKICLLTEQAAFSQSEELHSKLFELRNSALMIFAVCNILWLTIMLAILNQGEKLTLFKSNFLSVIFLIVYAIIMVMQFITLLIHRISTWLHFIARTPFKPGSKGQKSWSFTDEELPEEPSTDEIEEAREVIDFKIRQRSERRTIQAKQRAKSFRTHIYA